MSERLYRRTEQRMSYGWDGDDLFDTLVVDGWLVPVEPGRLVDRDETEGPVTIRRAVGGYDVCGMRDIESGKFLLIRLGEEDDDGE